MFFYFCSIYFKINMRVNAVSNKTEKNITVRKCSEPNKSLQQLQTILKIKPRPFVKLKSVVHRPELAKAQMQQNQMFRVWYAQCGLIKIVT